MRYDQGHWSTTVREQNYWGVRRWVWTASCKNERFADGINLLSHARALRDATEAIRIHKEALQQWKEVAV